MSPEYCKIVKLLKFLSAFSLSFSLLVFLSFLCWHVLILYLPFFNKNSHSSPQHEICKRHGGQAEAAATVNWQSNSAASHLPLPPLSHLFPCLSMQHVVFVSFRSFLGGFSFARWQFFNEVSFRFVFGVGKKCQIKIIRTWQLPAGHATPLPPLPSHASKKMLVKVARISAQFLQLIWCASLKRQIRLGQEVQRRSRTKRDRGRGR